jgi:hypothetical protein
LADIKLMQIPDRTPVRLTLCVSPELNGLLRDYAGFYEAAYGQSVAVAELIPAMLESFLQATAPLPGTDANSPLSASGNQSAAGGLVAGLADRQRFTTCTRSAPWFGHESISSPPREAGV